MCHRPSRPPERRGITPVVGAPGQRPRRGEHQIVRAEPGQATLEGSLVSRGVSRNAPEEERQMGTRHRCVCSKAQLKAHFAIRPRPARTRRRQLLIPRCWVRDPGGPLKRRWSRCEEAGVRGEGQAPGSYGSTPGSTADGPASPALPRRRGHGPGGRRQAGRADRRCRRGRVQSSAHTLSELLKRGLEQAASEGLEARRCGATAGSPRTRSAPPSALAVSARSRRRTSTPSTPERLRQRPGDACQEQAWQVSVRTSELLARPPAPVAEQTLDHGIDFSW